MLEAVIRVRLRLTLMCIVLLFILSVPAYASPVSVEDFGAVADVEISGDLEYKAIRLTPEIYAATQENLADIILCSGDEIVPYFINSSELASDVSKAVYEMTLSDSFVKDGYRYFDYELESPQENDIRATSLQTSTTDEFVKQIELFGSYDGLVWDKTADEKLYNVSGNQQLAIQFYTGQKYTHYRLKIPESRDKLAFQRVWLEYNAETITRLDFIDKIKPEFSVNEDNKTTVISLKGIRHLPISGIEIDTGDMFKRDVNVAGFRQTLYNLRFGDEKYKNLTISLSGYKSMSDTLEIHINNGDDSPIKINSITVSYLSDELIFKDPGGNVKLYFNNIQTSLPPQYDIGSYNEYIIAQGYDTLHIGQIKQLAPESEKEDKFDYGLILNITIALVAVVLAYLIIKRLHGLR